MEPGPDLLWSSSTQTVEDVVVPLLWTLATDPGLLQQVMRDEAAHHRVLTGDNRWRSFNEGSIFSSQSLGEPLAQFMLILIFSLLAV